MQDRKVQPVRTEPHPLAGPNGPVNTREAAAYVGMSPLTLVDWRFNKIGFPWISCGRAICYSKNALDAWADAHTFSPQAS